MCAPQRNLLFADCMLGSCLAAACPAAVLPQDACRPSVVAKQALLNLQQQHQGCLLCFMFHGPAMRRPAFMLNNQVGDAAHMAAAWQFSNKGVAWIKIKLQHHTWLVSGIGGGEWDRRWGVGVGVPQCVVWQACAHTLRCNMHVVALIQGSEGPAFGCCYAMQQRCWWPGSCPPAALFGSRGGWAIMPSTCSALQHLLMGQITRQGWPLELMLRALLCCC